MFIMSYVETIFAFLPQTKCGTCNRFWLRAQSLTSKENPPTCCVISCEAKGVVYHQASDLELGSTTPLTSQLIRQQVGGFPLMWDSKL